MRRIVIGAIGVSFVVSLLPGAATGADAMTFTNVGLGTRGGEPTLGVTPDGTILYQAYEKVLRSTDGGGTWSHVYTPASRNVSFDPYIHVDEVTGRAFSSQLLIACQTMSLSDDGGTTWLEAAQCPTGDHQKIGSGPWAAPVPVTATYPRAVYTCVNHVADTACAVSHDGGLTWGPFTVVMPGFDPGADTGATVQGLCSGLLGDPVSGPDGAIYVPAEKCGRPMLGISRDNGLTWSTVWVAQPARTLPVAWGANNPAVSVADDGTVFYAWTGSDWRHYVARSTDGGATWTSWLVSPADVVSTTFPLMIAGEPGAVATGYLGTRDTSAGPGDAPLGATWHLFVTYTLDGTAPSPTWTTVQVTTHPVMIGCIGRHGGSCSGSRGALLDFNDVAFLPDGRLVLSYTDGCVAPSCTGGTTSQQNVASIAVQATGPSLG